jgi:integrase
MSDEVIVSSNRQELQGVASLTWGTVIERVCERLEDQGKGGQKRNFKTAFKIFLEAIETGEEAPVGAELIEEFEAKIQVYVKFEIKRHVSETTYKPRVSKIRALKKFVDQNFAEALRIQSLPKAFGRRLRHLIVTLGYTVRSFWRSLPVGLVSYYTLRNWCAEQSFPCASNLPVIEVIEKYLNVPSGTLRLSLYHLSKRPRKVMLSDSSNKTRAALSKPYYVWTETLEQEFQCLKSHKTLPILPEGEERSEGGIWTAVDGAEVETAGMVKRILQSFMGFCALPVDDQDPYLRGGGIKVPSLSLALLTNKKLVEDYINFMRLRSGLRVRSAEQVPDESLPAHMTSADGKWVYYDRGGKYNRGSLLVLVNVLSLLRPKTGYLYQHPEFAEKLGTRMTATAWQEQCVKTWARMDNLYKTLSRMKDTGDQQNFDFGRDPKEIIHWILDDDHPLRILHAALKDMLDDLLPESAWKLERARQFRDILLFALLCSNPLRIRMYSMMEFGKNLKREDDGSWWIQFKRGAFKNRRTLKSDYQVRVARPLCTLLDRYKAEFHPVLIGTSKSNYVFVNSRIGQHTRQYGIRLGERRLSEIICNLTELYIPGCIGFRPHAFRHIVATDIIKKDPSVGFFLASVALHDKIETVEKEYIHLKTSEYFEPVNIHFGETWNFVFAPPTSESVADL